MLHRKVVGSKPTAGGVTARHTRKKATPSCWVKEACAGLSRLRERRPRGWHLGACIGMLFVLLERRCTGAGERVIRAAAAAVAVVCSFPREAFTSFTACAITLDSSSASLPRAPCSLRFRCRDLCISPSVLPSPFPPLSVVGLLPPHCTPKHSCVPNVQLETFLLPTTSSASAKDRNENFGAGSGDGGGGDSIVNGGMYALVC